MSAPISPNDGVLWPMPTDEQRAKSTPFCRYMHYACRADGLFTCSICGQRLYLEPVEIVR